MCPADALVGRKGAVWVEMGKGAHEAADAYLKKHTGYKYVAKPAAGGGGSGKNGKGGNNYVGGKNWGGFKNGGAGAKGAGGLGPKTPQPSETTLPTTIASLDSSSKTSKEDIFNMMR
ncbi:hypothetical protein PtrSN002B_007573 [Pyrenophora tritici-repentis]|nr:hypothetical protein A1F94_008265 [Pyrenophora tritici-repentis]KAI0583523.1 hypothetical protein Alg130_05640 [Pyrenophora tritici-repentis]KAI0610239.1 hypothetical protein TUN205_05531 [Pyrenophora tritici-repentis]KAI0618028.1 hypothetical protein TUN199_09984 [Pyrenophora tritici-repentis]KAI1525491.1 hypothetical protein PtrSN001C_010609 [Pyrenophora tritici-repentis]